MQYLSSDIVKHLRSNISRQIFFHACCVFINQTTQSIISQNPVCPSAPPLTYVLFNFYQNTPRNLLLITLSFLGDYNDVLILSEIRRIISFGGHSIVILCFFGIVRIFTNNPSKQLMMTLNDTPHPHLVLVQHKAAIRVIRLIPTKYHQGNISISWSNVQSKHHGKVSQDTTIPGKTVLVSSTLGLLYIVNMQSKCIWNFLPMMPLKMHLQHIRWGLVKY